MVEQMWILDTSLEQCLRTDRLLQSMNPGVCADLNQVLKWSTEKHSHAEKGKRGKSGGILLEATRHILLTSSP